MPWGMEQNQDDDGDDDNHEKPMTEVVIFKKETLAEPTSNNPFDHFPESATAGYGFDLWGVSNNNDNTTEASLNDSEIVFEEDEVGRDRRKSTATPMGSLCSGGDTTATGSGQQRGRCSSLLPAPSVLGIRALRHMPSDGLDITTELDDPYTREELSEDDAVFGMYRDAWKKTSVRANKRDHITPTPHTLLKGRKNKLQPPLRSPHLSSFITCCAYLAHWIVGMPDGNFHVRSGFILRP